MKVAEKMYITTHLSKISSAPFFIFSSCPSLEPNSSVESRTYKGSTWSCSSVGLDNALCFASVTTAVQPLFIL